MMRAALEADDETFQLEVCSSYNFHVQEEFKLLYWKRVLSEIIPADTTLKLSPNSVRDFWKNQVNPQTSLVGINAILGALLASEEAWLAAEVENRLQAYYTPRSFISAFLSVFASFGKRGRAPIGDSEEIVLKSSVEKISRKILKETAAEETAKSSVVLTETQISERIPQAIAFPEFIVSLVFLFFLESFGGCAFETDSGRAVKIALSGRKAEAVTLEDRARLAQREALANLEIAERELEKKIRVAEDKCREHLGANRKNLALNFLREKKLLENKITEIHNLRLKLAESASLGETAKIQQLVVETLSKSAALGKVEFSGMAAKAERVMEEVQEISESVTAVAQALAPSAEEDPELEAEFTALRLPALPPRQPAAPDLDMSTETRQLA